MSSLSAKDRVSLCSFTFSDGRRCRTPRVRNHPHFCVYHAQKEARFTAAQKLGKDLAYFFSGDYLSACDLSTALGRLIPAVLRGDVKPRAARTVAYLAQTLVQAIHISQHEYCEAFDTNDWRRAIRNSVKYNQDYLFPPAPKAEQPAAVTQPVPVAHHAQTPVNCHSERSEEPAFSSSPSQPPTHATQSEIPTASGPPPHRRALLCLPRAPNSFNGHWPGRIHPVRPEHPNHLVRSPAPLHNRHPNPSHRSPPHHPQRGKNVRQLPVRKQVRPAFQFWRLFPRGSRKHLQVLAPIKPFIINTYRNAHKC